MEELLSTLGAPAKPLQTASNRTAQLLREWRDIIKGVTTEKGLREYLVLLSLCETCKRRGISFVDFLCSGETDLDLFAGPKRTRSKDVVREGKTEATDSPLRESFSESIPATSESSADQLPSRGQWEAQYERALLQKELDAWSRFVSPTCIRGSRDGSGFLRLERYDGIPGGGALAALPALVESGLAGVDELFPPMIERARQEAAMALMAVASVSQTASIDALTLRAPTSWKRILFSEALPDDRSMADLIRLIASAPEVEGKLCRQVCFGCVLNAFAIEYPLVSKRLAAGSLHNKGCRGARSHDLVLRLPGNQRR
jgi:hypothetical protein